LGVLSLVIVFVICAVLSLWLAFQFGISLPEISWTVIFVFGTGFISLAIASWHTLSNRIIAKFTPPPVPQSKLLIIRMSADEASGILTTSQFGGWVLARMWSMVSNICGKVSSWQNKWAENKRPKYLDFIVGVAGGDDLCSCNCMAPKHPAPTMGPFSPHYQEP